MPFAEGQSVSPRVTPAILHPASMDAADAYGVIIDGRNFVAYSKQNQPEPHQRSAGGVSG